MNFKPELLAKVLNQEKTQTRRPVKADECAIDIYGSPGSPDSPYFDQLGPIKTVLDAKGRTRYEVGRVYAICPGRGKKQKGKMKLVGIRYQDARDITIEDVKAEGFNDHFEFFEVWCGFYDPEVLELQESAHHAGRAFWLQDVLWHQADKPYQCWALTFELVK